MMIIGCESDRLLFPGHLWAPAAMDFASLLHNNKQASDDGLHRACLPVPSTLAALTLASQFLCPIFSDQIDVHSSTLLASQSLTHSSPDFTDMINSTRTLSVFAAGAAAIFLAGVASAHLTDGCEHFTISCPDGREEPLLTAPATYMTW